MAAAGAGDQGAVGEVPGADSGNVSQSQSSASGLGEPEEEEEEEEEGWEASLSATAAACSAYLLADRSLFRQEIESLDKSLEDLLTRVDEFVGLLDMIRSDSSQVVNESIPEIYTKATEMRQIYRKIDKLEAFVKMIGNSVAGLEERVVKAETDFGAFPSTFKKILHTISIPSFLNTGKNVPEELCEQTDQELCKVVHQNLFMKSPKEFLMSEVLISSLLVKTIYQEHTPALSCRAELHTCREADRIKSSSSRQQQTLYEPPVLFKTEDYFPCLNEAPY